MIKYHSKQSSFQQYKLKKTLKPNFLEAEENIDNTILKGMAKIHANLKNQFNFKYQVVFLARFDKQNQNDQVLEEVELYNNLKNNRNLTESHFGNNDVRSQLEQQIHNQETKIVDEDFINLIQRQIISKSYWKELINLIENSIEAFHYFEFLKRW